MKFSDATYGAVPVQGSTDYSKTPSLTNNVIGYGTQNDLNHIAVEVGAANVWSWSTDVDQFFPSTSPTWSAPEQVYAESVLKYGDDDKPRPSLRYRVVASAFEVTNTTSQLNRQGTVTLVRQSCAQDIEYNLASFDTAGISPESTDFSSVAPWVGLQQFTYTNLQLPPRDLSAAMLAGGIQWDAAEGGYSVSTYDYENCDLRDSNPCQVSFRTGKFEPAGTVERPNSIATLAQDHADLGAGFLSFFNNKNSRQTCHFSPRDTVAHFYTGLSPSTTLNLSTRYYVEMAPREQDTEYANLVPLRQPSPLCDERALLIYQRAASKLLPGVPVHMNSFGDFFKQVWDTVKSVAAPLIKTALPIAGPLLLKAAPVIGNAILGRITRSKPKQQAVAVVQPKRKKKRLNAKPKSMQLTHKQVHRDPTKK